MMSAKKEVHKPQNRQATNCLVMLVAFTLIVGLLTFRYKVYDETRWTYRFHQRDLTAIVAKIKAASIPINGYKSNSFFVDRSLNPDTLRPYKPNSNEHAPDVSDIDMIVVYRRDKDDYLICIVIDDEGHLGRYGLLYTDAPLQTSPVPDYDYLSVDGPPPLRYLKQRLSPKWSYVFGSD